MKSTNIFSRHDSSTFYIIALRIHGCGWVFVCVCGCWKMRLMKTKWEQNQTSREEK